MNSRKNQLMCAWSGLIFLLMFFVGWAVIGGFLPPPSPGVSAQEVADFYRSNTNMIRLGLLITQASCIFYIPWIVGISVQLKRIEGPSPVCTYVQFLGGLTGIVAILLPYFFWAVAAFRPERDPALLQLLNDIGWLIFIVTFAPFVVQNLAIAVAIFSDRNPEPLFPRWVGYFNLWISLTFFPAGFVLFFKSGPFAWNGLIGFWVPLGAFSIWMIGMLVLQLKAIKRQYTPVQAS